MSELDPRQVQNGASDGDDPGDRAPQGGPARFARWLLHISCAPGRREEIAGDMHELYARRLRHRGRPHARCRYLLDVLDVCLRQLLSRTARYARRPGREGTLRIYPLRILALITTAAVLLTLLPSQAPWLVFVRNALLAAYPVVELCALAIMQRDTRAKRMGSEVR